MRPKAVLDQLSQARQIQHQVGRRKSKGLMTILTETTPLSTPGRAQGIEALQWPNKSIITPIKAQRE